MAFPKFSLKQAALPLLMLPCLAAIFAWMAMRNHGLYPMVFADEMMYSAFARLMPLSEAGIPSYLYLATYGVTNACGTDFLSCARLLNTLFLVAAAPFIYLCARAYTGRALSFVVTMLCMLAPINAFTAYFMPETMYFFAFFVLSWVALTRSHWHWARYAGVTGVLLGLMTMIKVHALFLVPALALFVALQTLQRDGLRRAGAAAALTAAAALATKFGIGCAIAGKGGLQLFGSFYGTQAGNFTNYPLLNLVQPALTNGAGHLMAMALLFGLPMAMLGASLLSRQARTEAPPGHRALYWYTFLMLGAAIGMTVMYTATIAPFGPREELRLHMRYYSFAFPLLLIVAASAIGAPRRAGGKVLDWVLAALLVAACLLAALKLRGYFVGMVDGPDIAALQLDTQSGKLLASLAVVTVLMWAARLPGAAVLYLFVLGPALAWNYQDKLAVFHTQVDHPSPFDSAGLAARELIRREGGGHVTVAGTGLAQLMRTKFQLDARDTTLLELDEAVPYDINHLPVHSRWLLVVGPHPLPPQLKPALATPDYALVRIGANHKAIAAADFSGPPLAPLLTGVEGLSYAEHWGRWSTAKQVVLHFAAPLPTQLNVVLGARAYGPNARQEFIARVGQAEKRFRVPATPTEVFLQFDTDGRQTVLRIEVPQPVSPSALGKSIDTRALGIGLSSVEIGTAPP